MNPHQARIARKKLQRKTIENHFVDAIFFHYFSTAIFFHDFSAAIFFFVQQRKKYLLTTC